MKKSTLWLLAIISAPSIEAGSVMFDASRRYGPNSFIYNTPLYFNARDGRKKLRRAARPSNMPQRAKTPNTEQAK